MGKCGARRGLGLRGFAAVGLVWALSGLAAQAACEADTVELKSATGSVVRFSVEVADDEAERAKGLMDRMHMPSAAGMLFVYPSPRQAFFWMKNTRIPLDMLFADVTGKVTRVHENAVPMDETSIDGGPDVAFVLEINGGLARRMGLTEGAVMRSDLIDPAVAAWACDAP